MNSITNGREFSVTCNFGAGIFTLLPEPALEEGHGGTFKEQRVELESYPPLCSDLTNSQWPTQS